MQNLYTKNTTTKYEDKYPKGTQEATHSELVKKFIQPEETEYV